MDLQIRMNMIMPVLFGTQPRLELSGKMQDVSSSVVPRAECFDSLVNIIFLGWRLADAPDADRRTIRLAGAIRMALC